MATIFVILFIVGIVGLVVGIIKPSLIKPEMKRREAILGAFVLVIISFIGLAIAGGSNSAESETQPQSGKSPVQEEQPLSEKDQIRKLVSDKLQGQTVSTKKDRLRKVDVEEQVDGGWGVFVEFNADDNLTTSLRKGGIEMKMSEIYISLYTSGKDIRQASISAYFPLADKYGNEKDGVVYKSILKKDEAAKVNFEADLATLQLEILPKVWTTSLLHQEFR